MTKKDIIILVDFFYFRYNNLDWFNYLFCGYIVLHIFLPIKVQQLLI